MRYTDDIISFEIPEGFSKKVNTGNGYWQATSKNHQSFQIYLRDQGLSPSVETEFEDFYNRCSEFLTRIDIPVPKIAGCRRAAYSERILMKENPPYVEVEVRLLFENDLLVIRIWDYKTGECFQIDRYIPSIESIELDFEKLHVLLQNIKMEKDRQIQEAINKANTEQARKESEEHLVKMGQKGRAAYAAKLGVPEEFLFPNLVELIEKYGEDCVREGYLPGEKPKKNRLKPVSEHARKILDEMDADSDNPYRFLPDLEHGYFFTAGSRITLFGDENRWAMAFEKSGYANRGLRIEIEVDYFGNCLSNLDTAGMNGMYVCNMKNFSLADTSAICDDPEVVSPEIETITIRGERLQIPRDSKIYKKKKIELANPEEIGIVELTRLLDETYPELFRATDDEIRTCIPADLPQIMVIDKWHQPAFNGDDMGTMPSEHETFRLIAEVLATLDPLKWKPKKKPNNDWRNWPEAGGL